MNTLLASFPADREGRLSVSVLTHEDISILAGSLSLNSLDEIRLLDLDPIEVLELAVEQEAYVLRLDDDLPIACFGLNKNIHPASIWLLVTPLVGKHAISFHKLSKRWVDMFSARNDVANIVPSNHHGTIKWLKSLDFAFENEPYTFNGSAFLRFSKGAQTRSLPH